jgi:hypothetical protein
MVAANKRDRHAPSRSAAATVATARAASTRRGLRAYARLRFR